MKFLFSIGKHVVSLKLIGLTLNAHLSILLKWRLAVQHLSELAIEWEQNQAHRKQNIFSQICFLNLLCYCKTVHCFSSITINILTNAAGNKNYIYSSIYSIYKLAISACICPEFIFSTRKNSNKWPQAIRWPSLNFLPN